MSACCIHPPDTAVDDAVCRCANIKQTDGWCGHCQVGYLAGIKIESAMFFEALDAHGHDIDPTLLRCDRCKKAYESHGYCAQSKMGFVRKKTYFSKLTYYLARGELKDASSITCPICLKNTQKPDWCEACRVGMVGFHAYGDREEFTHAARMREILTLAIDLAGKCMTCALAMINDDTCLPCKVTFKDGSKVARTLP